MISSWAYPYKSILCVYAQNNIVEDIIDRTIGYSDEHVHKFQPQDGCFPEKQLILRIATVILMEIFQYSFRSGYSSNSLKNRTNTKQPSERTLL